MLSSLLLLAAVVLLSHTARRRARVRACPVRKRPQPLELAIWLASGVLISLAATLVTGSWWVVAVAFPVGLALSSLFVSLGIRLVWHSEARRSSRA